MSSKQFDLVVLGTGPSGGTVASKIARSGKRVALVDSRTFGGVCALRGCNPKKVYVNAGQLVDQVHRGNGRLVSDASLQIDWKQLHAFKTEFTQPVADKKEQSFQDDGIKTFHGVARFVAPDTIDVVGTKLTAERFLIATGGRPRELSFAGAENVTRSDEFLELETLPDHVVFIGGGYISLEFAGVVARAGRRVTVIEKNARVLAGFDPDLVDQLTGSLRDNGVQFQLNAEISRVEKSKDGRLQIHFANQESPLPCGLAIHGAGRVPNIDELCLSQGEIVHGENGVTVNSFMQNPTNPRVFATGDCADNGMPRLTPVANEDARIAAKNLFSEKLDRVPDYGHVPKVAFTIPSIASVGLSEEEARQTNHNLDVLSDDISSWGSVRKIGPTVAGYKLLIDSKTDVILGAHLLGPSAEETINLFALAMKFNLTATDMKSTLFAFPTFASDVRSML
ncbi:glutathione reductase [Rhodopirellula islandica]|uniref:Glutathione reductase n=1 Tax=Rhodopirellula islandica TaxID=595434 RepID=A0A0J1BHG6_RHOIS|nr:NAD(P)/FAD-dependent oxidoreductase [Rhodopirellula islandica]KLU05977.1 glutathione reductase [Rhodopirellula islandica]